MISKHIHFTRCIPKFVQDVSIRQNEVIYTINNQSVIPFFTFMKNHEDAQYNLLVDITAVDSPHKEERFTIVYQLLSIRHNARITVKVNTTTLNPIDSLTPLFHNATWYEREIYDMFGIGFHNNNDLRRILTDYGFQGHPLRKDFPLSGYVEVRYDDSEKRVITEPLQLAQEFRSFELQNPWTAIK